MVIAGPRVERSGGTSRAAGEPCADVLRANVGAGRSGDELEVALMTERKYGLGCCSPQVFSSMAVLEG
jgi:hypothetical protein